jgi:hypothetical protein
MNVFSVLLYNHQRPRTLFGGDLRFAMFRNRVRVSLGVYAPHGIARRLYK